MITDFYNDVTIDRIKKDASKIQIGKDDNYVFSYPHFLKYFQNNPISKHSLIIGINLTYGWMPTIFKFRTFDLDDVIEILIRAKSGISIEISELDTLKNCLNNSIIGTSKLLHFINPNEYPIFDSNVYSYLTKKRPHSYSVNSSSFYFEFIGFCRNLSKMEEFAPIHVIINKKIGYEVTKMRALELIMFYNSKSDPLNQ